MWTSATLWLFSALPVECHDLSLRGTRTGGSSSRCLVRKKSRKFQWLIELVIGRLWVQIAVKPPNSCCWVPSISAAYLDPVSTALDKSVTQMNKDIQHVHEKQNGLYYKSIHIAMTRHFQKPVIWFQTHTFTLNQDNWLTVWLMDFVSQVSCWRQKMALSTLIASLLRMRACIHVRPPMREDLQRARLTFQSKVRRQKVYCYYSLFPRNAVLFTVKVLTCPIQWGKRVRLITLSFCHSLSLAVSHSERMPLSLLRRGRALLLCSDRSGRKLSPFLISYGKRLVSNSWTV